MHGTLSHLAKVNSTIRLCLDRPQQLFLKMLEVLSDKHMGHLIIEAFMERPNAICQVDAATGESETNASVLNRSVQLAQCMRSFGLAPGDVLALQGKNHLDLHIPHYAALLNGLPVVGVDPMFKIDEIKALFKIALPKIAFCEPENYDIYLKVAVDLGINFKVIVFGNGDNSMQEFVESHQEEFGDYEKFQPAVFDQNKVYAWLVSTSGTTGIMKLAAIKHSCFIKKMETMLIDVFSVEGSESPTGITKPVLILSPVNWISGFYHAVGCPLLRQTKIQTSAPAALEHIIDVINKYKPMLVMIGPSLAIGLVKAAKHCDLSCFKQIIVSAAKVYADIWRELKRRVNKDAVVVEFYGQTENIGHVLEPNPNGPPGNCGIPSKHVKIKLVDPDTGKEITEPNVTGELWTNCVMFTEYFNDPVMTAEAITADGWYKTGDLLYRDENNNYFFVERLKMLIKYRNYHVIPLELEEVIRSHPGVQEVSVTSIPHLEDGEHPVACVVRRPGVALSALEIKDLVADKLSEAKQLRGGVIFLEALPMTSSGKMARSKLRPLALSSHRE